jgi:hypothetical protein
MFSCGWPEHRKSGPTSFAAAVALAVAWSAADALTVIDE